MSIIRSLADTDLYKFTMMQVIWRYFPSAQAAYRFKCRNANVDLRPFVKEIGQEIEALAELRLTTEELDFLASQPFISPEFVDFLDGFRLNPKLVDLAGITDPNRDLVAGNMVAAMPFEIPVLSIVTETYYRNVEPNPNFDEGRRRLEAKMASIAEMPERFKITEMGTRRRFSRAWQEEVMSRMVEGMPTHLGGTSNVDLARRFGLNPVGTMAHEFLQACQVLSGNLREFQKFAFELWSREYRGLLGIALSDTIGLDAFREDFDRLFCKQYDGARHDSGDPYNWGEQMIEQYEGFDIDPRTKILLFSNRLDFNSAMDLFWQFNGRAIPRFGIGTDITNDLGYPSLDSVIKIVRCNGLSVAKLSDDPGKTMSPDVQYVDFLRSLFSTRRAANYERRLAA